MKNYKITFHIITIAFLFFPFSLIKAFSPINEKGDTGKQPKEEVPLDWFNLDPVQDKVKGISTQQAYETLSNKKSKTVIVAIIDSGIDIEHEDLKDVIWKNEDEIAGNGIDDDNNGYIDDIHGWNFIGGKDGENVDEETFELTRLMAPLHEKFEGKTKAEIQREEKKEFKLYLGYLKKYNEEKTDAILNLDKYTKLHALYMSSFDTMKELIGTDSLTIENVNSIDTIDAEILRFKDFVLYALSNGLREDMLNKGIEHFQYIIEKGLNFDFDPRHIVNDNYEDDTERYYGNNDVTGPDPMHGTHVAGIVAANRTNEIGIKGIANNVKIMAIRAVPNGDERDKDVANAIRYAVDNGAQIINMSFGKAYTYRKYLVDEAILYAQSKNVLLIHAAGNDAENNDKIAHYPSRYISSTKKDVTNWIEVGASSFGDNEDMVAYFSNYGKKTVDVFAPGVDIYSTMPGSEYEKKSGTSMAAPVVTGIAALLLSYFPDLSAEQLKEVILTSSLKYKNEKVNLPSESDKAKLVKFKKLSTSGGIVNAYQAILSAEGIKKN